MAFPFTSAAVTTSVDAQNGQSTGVTVFFEGACIGSKLLNTAGATRSTCHFLILTSPFAWPDTGRTWGLLGSLVFKPTVRSGLDMLKSGDTKRPHRCSRLGRPDDLMPCRAANVSLFEVVSCLQISSHSRSPSGCQFEAVFVTRFWQCQDAARGDACVGIDRHADRQGHELRL